MTDVAPLPAVLRVPDLARLLGLSESAVRDLLARGDIPASKVGRQWVVRGQALLEHLRANEPQARPRDVVQIVRSAQREVSRADLERLVHAAR